MTIATYAKCEGCGQTMNPGTACTVARYTYAGNIAFNRIPYGDEERYGSDWKENLFKELHCCHDCNVAPGQLHHTGCDMEECPKCHRQSISCDCE